MQIFNTIEPAAREFIKIALQKYGIDLGKLKLDNLQQEDFLLVSKKYPIFVVADGVTLIQFIIDKKSYPKPSPAGVAARIFCEELLKAAEEKYETFKESDIKDIFDSGNKAVGRYNQECGRTKETADYWWNDFYAATAAFVVLKDNVAYWGSICDSYVAHFNKDSLVFRSPTCDSRIERDAPKFKGDANNEKEKTKYVWSVKRNGISAKGELIGYGVVTGEEIAKRYLNLGTFKVKKDDFIAVFTDGFEDYMKLSEFRAIFYKEFDDLDKRAKDFAQLKIAEDPDKFGHERSLIIVSV